ncbi:MAG: hypothetical protein B1H08_03575 [Candidatus Omnitrophica bacterium 4484_171]|nr:MAG: hypothetical protein B1H08_03575 [Candidatus Omnitrophica bacterium 4484_171]
MEALTIKEILDVTGGKILFSSYKDDTVVKNISTDSRTIKKGDLFVALKGERFDGHKFVLNAYEKKAQAALISKDIHTKNRKFLKHFYLIKVKDTLRALGDIAAYYRDKFKVSAVGVTGSNGKTTTKNMIAALLSSKFSIISSYASFNNFIGVPLTVFRIRKDTDILVQEMETNILGGIERLSYITKPSVGVVTNIGPTHLESLKTEYNVFREKSELVKSLTRDGSSVINRDDNFFMELKKQSSSKRIITFGINKSADFKAENIRMAKEGIYFSIGRVRFFLPTLFYKNVYNALAAISVSKGIFGISLKQSALLLKDFRFPHLRAQLIKTQKALIINDCFNANPQSMEDAISMLIALRGNNKIAVLGDMFELGTNSDKFHYKIGRFCANLNLDALITYGRKSRFIARGAKDNGLNRITCCKTHKDVVKSLINDIKPPSVVLVKGSRAMRMENIVRELLRKLRK